MRQTRGRFWIAEVGAFALVTGALVAAPATAIAPVEPASAATVQCDQLLHGQPCTLRYDEHPGLNSIVIPSGIPYVTFMLAGASGAGGGSDQGDPGPGGMVIATVSVDASRTFDVWLGERASGRSGGSVGWAPGGDGGRWLAGNDGYGGGAASAILRAGAQHGDPLAVAGGGGGGGGSVVNAYHGGAGGYGGMPPGDGANGQGNAYGAGGQGGDQSGPGGGEGGHNDGDPLVGAGGGGGGGGWRGGDGGGFGTYAPYFGFSSAGGGGGGSSYASEDIDLLGTGAAPLGDGFVTIFPGQANTYVCDGSGVARTIVVPDDVEAYAVIAVGAAGSPGNSKARGGHGAVVSGVLNVSQIDQLRYWVGCAGDRDDGAGYGFGRGGAGGDAPSPFARDGGRGGGATAVAFGDTMLIAAGGGGGSGGDIANCDTAPGPRCGGMGGSGGGTPGSRLPANGADGSGGDGGDGGRANYHYHDGNDPDPNGDEGVSPACCDESGGGGGGGSGYPMGGEGGHHSTWEAGGGGGAGGSYYNSHYVSGGSIATSGAPSGDGYLLLLPIVVPKVPITIHKEVTGPASHYAQGPFTMHVQCLWGGEPSLDTTFQLAPDGQQTVHAPSGSTCTVTETGIGGASGPAPPQTFDVDDTPTTITMTNEFAATSLEVTVRSQVIDEGGQPVTSIGIQPGQLTVGVYCLLDGHELALPAPVVGGALVFDGGATFPDGVTQTIEGLPVDAICAVAQHPGSGATGTMYQVDGVPSGPDQPFTLIDGENSVEVDNTYDLAPLAVSKTWDGDGTLPDDAAFAGEVACTFHGSPVTFAEPPGFTGLEVGGTVEVRNLPVGARCTVTETQSEDASAVRYSPAQTVPIATEDTAVTITNTYDTGTMLVHVAASGPGIAWANSDFELHVVCTDESIPAVVLDDTFSVPPGGGWRSYSPDENVSCTVTELLDGGATTVRYSSSTDPTPSTDPVTVTVGADPVALTVSNMFEAAPLAVGVTPSGAGAGFADPSTVTVGSCTFNGLPIEVAPAAPEVQLGFPAAGGRATIPELVAGAECTATLADTGGATTATVDVGNGAPDSAVGDWGATLTVHPPGTSVVFATQFDVASLDVEVVVAGAAAWAANTPYKVEVACTLDGTPIDQLGPGGVVPLQFTADGTPVQDHARELLGTLPVGASCALDETGSGGATSVSYDPDGPVVVTESGSSATVTNIFEAATLTVGKTVGGNDAAAHTQEPFTFQVGCTFNGLPLGNPPTDPARATTFPLIDGQTAAFGDLPVGADCTVIEIDSRHATSVSPAIEQTVVLSADGAAISFVNTFDVASLTIRELVTGPGAQTYGLDQDFVAQAECAYPDGTPARLPEGGRVVLNVLNTFTQTVLAPVGTTCTAVQGIQLATTQSVSPPVRLVLGDAHTVTIASDYELGDLTIAKTAVGDFDADQGFPFAVECTWPAWVGPPGQPDPIGPVPIPLNEFAPGVFSLQSGQERTVQALAFATCASAETPPSDVLRVVSTASGHGAVSGSETASVVTVADQPGVIDVTNYMPGSLPVTGAEFGSGAALALALLALGLLVLALRRRMQRRKTVSPSARPSYSESHGH